MADNIGINQGTAKYIATDEVGTAHYQVIKLDIGADGTTSAFTGTIPEITNLAGGTVNTLSLEQPNKWQAVVNVGTSTVGTVKAAVVGSAIYLTDLIISVGTTATNVEFGDGGTANLLLGTLYFAANGGMVSNFKSPIYTTAGSALVYKQSGNVDLSITAGGYIK